MKPLPTILLMLPLLALAQGLWAINATWNGGPNAADWQDIAQWTPVLGAGQQPGFDTSSGNRASFAAALDSATLNADTLATTLLDVQRENVRILLGEGVTLNATSLDLAADASVEFALANGATSAEIVLPTLNLGANCGLTIGEGITLSLTGTSYDFSSVSLSNAGSIVFDAATAGGSVAITAGANLDGALRLNSAAGAGMTLDVLEAGSFTMRGAGDALINGNVELSGAIDKQGSGLLRLGSVPGDTSEIAGGIAIKGGDFTIPGNALLSGANISFVGAGDVSLGDTIFTGAIQALTLDSARDITGFVRVDDGAELSVNSAMVLAGPLYVGTGLSGRLELLGDVTFEGDVAINRNAIVRARRPLTFQRDLSVGDGAEFVSEALATLSNPGFTTNLSVDADVSSFRFNRGLSVEGALTLRSTGGTPGGQPGVLQVDGDLSVAASISDTNSANLARVLDLELAGDLLLSGVSSLDLADTALTFAGPLEQSIRLVSGAPAAGLLHTGAWTLQQSLRVDDSLPDGSTLNIGALTIADNRSIDLSNYNTTIRSAIHFGAGVGFAQSGAVAGTSGTITFDASNADWTIDLSASTGLEVLGDLHIRDGGAGNSVLLTQGSSLTLRGALSVHSGTFGAQEDGATDSGRAWIELHGDLSAAAQGRLAPGEATWRLHGDVDLSAGDDLVQRPDPANDQAPRVELAGGVTSLAFSDGGSGFFINHVEATTAIRQSGRMILVGPLDISRSNADPAWDGRDNNDAITDALVLGARSFGNSTVASETPALVSLGAQPVWFERLEARNVNNGNSGEYNSFRIQPAESLGADARATLHIGAMSFEGDALVDDNAMTDDQNAPRVWLERLQISISEASTLGAGANGNRGAWLNVDSCQLSFEREAGITLQDAPSAAAGATLNLIDTPVAMGRESSLLAGSGSALSVRASSLQRVSVSGTQDFDFTIDANQARSTWLSRVDLRALGTGLADLRVGGEVRVMDCQFWNLNEDGLRIAGDTTIRALGDNTFWGPIVSATWSHLTFEAPGLAAGSITGSIGNRFMNTDASRPIQNNTTNSRAFVIGSLSNDFGVKEDGTPLTATNTRVRDESAQGNIIVLGDLEGIGIGAALSPTSMLIAGGGEQELIRFDLKGVGPNVVRSATFRMVVQNGDLGLDDLRDGNGDLTLALSDGIERVDISTSNGATITTNGEQQDFTITFAGLENALNAGGLMDLPRLQDRTATWQLLATIGDFAGSTRIDVALVDLTRAVDSSRVSGVAGVRNLGLSIAPARLSVEQGGFGDQLATAPGAPLVVVDATIHNSASTPAAPVSGSEIEALTFGVEVRSEDPNYDPSAAVNNLPGGGVFSLYLDADDDGLPGQGELISAQGVLSPTLAAGGNRVHTLTFTLGNGQLQIPADGRARLLVLMGVSNDSAGAYSAAENAELELRLTLLASGVSQSHTETVITGTNGGALAASSAVWGLAIQQGKGKTDDSCSLISGKHSSSLLWLLAIALLPVVALRRQSRSIG